MAPSSTINWKNLRTGLLFVSGIVLAAVLGLVIGKNTSLLSGLTNVYIFVQDVQGLAENNFVSVSGKKVGTVSTMKFTTRNDTQGVVVKLLIRSEFEELITKDSKAKIKSLGVLGDKYIDITPGIGQPIREGDFITVVSEPGLDQLTTSALDVMNKLGDLLDKVNKGEGTVGKLVTSTELIDRLNSTAANLDKTTNRLANGNGIVAKMINDEQLANNVASLVTNLNGLSRSLKNGEGSLGKLMTDDTFYKNLNAVSARADSLIARLENPKGTLGRLSNDPALYENLNRTVNSLDSLVTDLKRNPERYVKLSLF